MALVDYSSSDDDDEKNEAEAEPSLGNLKRKRDNENTDDLPPLPSKFHDLYASTARVSTRDDPSLHGGRKRVTPHIEGNWPTHLYIEWYPATTEYELLSKLISNLKDGLPPGEASKVNSFLTSDLGAPLPLHISLSRPIGFSTEQKDDFVHSLEATIKSSGIRPFDITFSGLHWVANFEKTRWFLVFRINQPEFDGLNKLLHVSNSVVQEYGQPPLYATPVVPPKDVDVVAGMGTKNATKTTKATKLPNIARASKAYWKKVQDVSGMFHISIAWTLEVPGQDLRDRTESIVTDHFKGISQTKFNVRDIKAKVGNTVTSMSLHTNMQETKSLFGL